MILCTIYRPDSRVIRLIERMGSQVNPNQKRILCMNKIDLVEKKKDLLKVAEEFKDLPGYERYAGSSCTSMQGMNAQCSVLKFTCEIKNERGKAANYLYLLC